MAHQDRDEEDLSAPVVSFSIGDSAVFGLGGAERRGPLAPSNCIQAMRWCWVAPRD